MKILMPDSATLNKKIWNKRLHDKCCKLCFNLNCKIHDSVGKALKTTNQSRDGPIIPICLWGREVVNSKVKPPSFPPPWTKVACTLNLVWAGFLINLKVRYWLETTMQIDFYLSSVYITQRMRH
jgi:hypothetical protein